MSNLTGAQLSHRVAELYGIPAQNGSNLITTDTGAHSAFLHEDDARCFRLMLEYEISIDWEWCSVASTGVKETATEIELDEGLDDKGLRTAILQCLVKIKESS